MGTSDVFSFWPPLAVVSLMIDGKTKTIKKPLVFYSVFGIQHQKMHVIGASKIVINLRMLAPAGSRICYKNQLFFANSALSMVHRSSWDIGEARCIKNAKRWFSIGNLYDLDRPKTIIPRGSPHQKYSKNQWILTILVWQNDAQKWSIETPKTEKPYKTNGFWTISLVWSVKMSKNNCFCKVFGVSGGVNSINANCDSR